MQYKGYIKRALEQDGDEQMCREMRELADNHPLAREYILGLLHEHAMAQRAARTMIARQVATRTLHDIENK